MNSQIFVTLAAVFFFLGVAVTYLAITWENERKARQGKAAAQNDAARLGDLARVRRDFHTGALSLEIDGKTYPSAADLDEGAHKIMDEFVLWLGRAADASAQAAEDPGRPDNSDAPPAEAASAGQAAPSKAVKAGDRPSTASNPDAVDEVVPIKFDLIASLTRTLRSDVPKFERSLTVAMQVDAILQAKLVGGPYTERGIRLIDQPDHSLAVMIGLEKYDGVEAIPDEAIRELIRTAVDEWRAANLKQ